MVIGLLTVQLLLEGCDSLKDKRQILKSLIGHLRNEFNISVAETADHDIWRQSEITSAVVTNDAKFADQVMAQVINHIERDPRVILQNVSTELL